MINRATLLRMVRKATALSYRESALCVDTVIDALAEGISRGDRVELRGLGSFTVKQVSIRRHPGIFSEEKLIPAHGRITFRPCQKLRELVWNKVSGS